MILVGILSVVALVLAVIGVMILQRKRGSESSKVDIAE